MPSTQTNKSKRQQNLYSTSSTKSEAGRDELRKKRKVIDLDDVPRPRPKRSSRADTDDDEDDRPQERRKKKPLRADRAERPKSADHSLGDRSGAKGDRNRSDASPSRDLVLPKKLRKNNLPATFDEKPKQRISKMNASKMKSILGDSAESIHQMLEVDDNQSAVGLLQKRLLQEVVDLIPYAVNGVRKTKGQRGVYQVNSLITSIREIMLDIQASMDRSSTAMHVVDQVLRPAWMDIAMAITQEDHQTKLLIRSLVSNDVYDRINKTMEESIGRTAALMQRKFDEAKEKTSQMMSK